MKAQPKVHTGENVVRIEAEALRDLAERISGPMAAAFERCLELMFACKGRVVVTGMGKSGIIARKIAATLSSTGTPSLFMHPAEAMHGDLGMLVRGDVVVALSSSGETEEIVRLLAMIKRIGVALITMTCDHLYSSQQSSSDKILHVETRHAASQIRKNVAGTAFQNRDKLSTLAAAADVALDCSIAQEACSLGLAPTASTTTMLALGDALAVSLAEKRGFKEEDFADLHPGGKLGKRLAKVRSLMHSGEAVPRVSGNTKMPEVIYEMSRKKLGITTVVEGEKLMGVISDGDLRRLLERKGKDVMDLTAAECITAPPQTIAPDAFATSALGIMEQRKITSLVVVDGARVVLGIIHLHDLWGTEMV